MEIEPVEIELRALLQGAYRLVQQSAAKQRVELITEVAPGSRPLWADQRAAKQILFNLLSNALKFTREGGRITVEAVGAPDNGTDIRVSDTGVGISPDQIDRVLRPFEQVDNSYTRAAGGTGLGLSLVKALLELHGGGISIVSALGAGTCVTAHFPPQPARS